MYNPYNKDYENKILENLKNRAKLLIEADKDPKFRACLIAKCKEDPKYFFNNFLYTVKNSTFFSPDMPEDIPFMLFDYQEDVVDEIHGCIMGRENVFVEKSRQMSLTWLVLWLFIHGFVFNNHRYCVISRTEDEVDGKGAIDSCFGRLRYMIARLPQWMLPPKFPKTKGEDYNKSMALTRSDWVGSIIGKTANKDAGRGGTYTAILMDEMAFMENATQINGACSSATPCRIMNSTPNGEGNEYFRMRALARQGKIKGITLHWSLHPFYTKDWYEWRTAWMTPEDIERELEINYNVSVKWRVYPRFAQAPLGDVRFLDVKYDYTLPLYVSIDNSHGWEDPHAVIVFQTESNWDINIIDSLQKNCSFTEMAHFLAKKPLQWVMTDKEQAFFLRWMGYKNPIFIADPYDTESTMNDTSISAEYAKVGINLVTPDILKGGSMIKEQIRLTTQAMNRLVVNPMNTEFISAIQNASYPQRPENSQSTSENTKPIHNWTSHFRTALEYAILFLTQEEKKNTVQEPIYTQVPNYATGELEWKLQTF